MWGVVVVVVVTGFVREGGREGVGEIGLFLIFFSFIYLFIFRNFEKKNGKEGRERWPKRKRKNASCKAAAKARDLRTSSILTRTTHPYIYKHFHTISFVFPSCLYLWFRVTEGREREEEAKKKRKKRRPIYLISSPFNSKKE